MGSVWSKYVNRVGFLHCSNLLSSVEKWWKSLKLFYIKWHVLNWRERNFTFSWLAWYGGMVVRIQNRVSACICIFNVWPVYTLHCATIWTQCSGHLVIYLDIYDSSGVKTLSPLAISTVQSEGPNVQIILSCHLVRRIATPGATHGGSSGGLTTAHLVQI